MKADKILTNAAELIATRGAERDKEDGERSMERCVRSFNEMTGHNLTETDGWKFMMFLKMARMEGGAFKFDDYEDNVSYAALMAESAVKEFGTVAPEVFDGVDAFSFTIQPFIGIDLAKAGTTDETVIKNPNYDDYEVCPKCGGKNAISIKDRTDGFPSEVETRCRKCSHLDYWAFGYYEIGAKQHTEVVE